MKATARRSNGRVTHEVEIGSFRFTAGAPASEAGAEGTPTPQELLAASLAASCTLTMEAYAKHRRWDIGDVAVEVDYEVAQRGSPGRCGVVVCLPEHLPEEQRKSLMSAVAKSPLHRTLEGETMFHQRLELSLPTAAGNGQPAGAPSQSSGLLARLVRPARRGARGPRRRAGPAA